MGTNSNQSRSKKVNSLNSVIISGEVVCKHELIETPKGTKVLEFIVACTRYYELENEKHEEISWLDVEAWSKQAVLCAEHLNKGRLVRVIGRLKEDRWISSEWKEYNRIKIVADHIEFGR